MSPRASASGEGSVVRFELEVERAKGVPIGVITVDRPPVNVLDLSAIEEIHEAIDSAVKDRGVSILTLCTVGDVFSAGVSVQDHLPDKLDAMLERFHDLCRRLLTIDAVIVARVQGRALGGAFELLACCDFVIASENAEFAQPEIELACFPPLGATLYPVIFGPARASELILLGRSFSAQEMHHLGLVHRVCTSDRLASATEELIEELARKSPSALTIAKRALARGRLGALDGLAEIEHMYREELAATEDMEEGLRAFLEKRPPSWSKK